ncbi:MAG: aminoglycoside phosphotransferase family protein [Sporichthyaceae bacterium]|nr:aminoglycoside phosphotransferase family protein [Sporichthyaceae bacterium]
MSASKQRPAWSELPASARGQIEHLVGDTVTDARGCPGGYSPRFASQLSLADGRQVFVKAMDSQAWPHEADAYRTEARIAAGLPASPAVPWFLGSLDAAGLVALAFEWVHGSEPTQPWKSDELDRVVTAIGRLAPTLTPAPIELPADHPRLGGWAELTADPARLARLRHYSAWAAGQLPLLVELERGGLEAARGGSMAHFDLYPHNILLTPDRVVVVDWPHARLGAPYVDLLMLLSSAAADGIDPDPIVGRHPLTAEVNRHAIDAVLAAHASFLVAGGLAQLPPALRPIAEAKRRLGHGALAWLKQRLSRAT